MPMQCRSLQYPLPFLWERVARATQWPEPGEGSVANDSHHRPVSGRIRGAARRMRHDPTDAEAKMWHLLRDRRLVGFKFRRQVPFRNYVLVFACFHRRIVVEVDGSQHGSKRDQIREAALAAEGFRVVRYWNNDVLQRPRAVLEDLLNKLES